MVPRIIRRLQWTFVVMIIFLVVGCVNCDTENEFSGQNSHDTGGEIPLYYSPSIQASDAQTSTNQEISPSSDHRQQVYSHSPSSQETQQLSKKVPQSAESMLPVEHSADEEQEIQHAQLGKSVPPKNSSHHYHTYTFSNSNTTDWNPFEGQPGVPQRGSSYQTYPQHHQQAYGPNQHYGPYFYPNPSSSYQQKQPPMYPTQEQHVPASEHSEPHPSYQPNQQQGPYNNGAMYPYAYGR